MAHSSNRQPTDGEVAPPREGDGVALIEVKGITKTFPGVRALQDVSFSIRPGEIVALIGENGAGKSTLNKILAGVYRPDGGEVLLRGERIELTSPHRAQQAGIQVIYQEHTLAPDLTAVENVFLGRERRTYGLLDEAAMTRRAKELFAEFGADDADLHRQVRGLGALRQRLVEIIKALAFDADLVIMDEPTAALPDNERAALFDHVRRIRDRGVSVLLVTHRLEELFGLADRAVVLRDGRVVGEATLAQATVDDLVRTMVGRDIGSLEDAVAAARGELRPDNAPVMQVEGLTRGRAPIDVSFSLRRGEILGIAGMAGSGRTELARALVGADRSDSGVVLVGGRPLRRSTPRAALAGGVALVPEERKVQGIFGDLSVAHNVSISSLGSLRRFGLMLDRRQERDVARRYVGELGIRTPSTEQKMKYLSGGNQQKAIVARALHTGAKVLIFDEPTQGIDVGAKLEIYRVIEGFVREGGSAIVITSELNELLAVSHRILVVHRGRKVGEVAGRLSGETDTQRHEREQRIISLAADGAAAGRVSEGKVPSDV